MQTKVMKYNDAVVNETAFGSLTWYVSAGLGNSETMTVGRCIIKPGLANPVHIHPNCDEVLHVVSGRIRHSMEDGKTAEMGVGDTISVPAGIPHNAENIGDTEAVCMIAFSSADRRTENE